MLVLKLARLRRRLSTLVAMLILGPALMVGGITAHGEAVAQEGANDSRLLSLVPAEAVERQASSSSRN